MLSIVLSVVAALVIGNIAVELLILRGYKSSRSAARAWETVPVVGFLGIVVLALSFVESTRRDVPDAWRWGLLFGIGLGLIAAFVMWQRGNRPAVARASGFRAWIHLIRTYGLTLLLTVLGVIITVRIVGPVLQVFIASAIGAAVLIVAIAFFAATWRNRKIQVSNDK